MPAKVAPGARDTICDFADGFIVHVTGASDVDAALRALGNARLDIAALAPPTGPGEDGPVISNAVLAPRGPLLRVARLGVDDDVLRTVPDLVVRHLDEMGAGDATVTAPTPGGSLDRLDSCANAVVLRLFPAPAGEDGTLPAAWIDIACEWVLGDSAPGDTVPARLLGIGFDLPASDAPSIVHQASGARAWCDLVNGDLDDRVRTASITFGRAPHVALAAGGPGCDSSALVARFELLCEVARELAPDVAYACVDVEETFECVGLGLTDAAWRDSGGASPNLVAGELVDVLVPDAFPYQILGKGHLARFGPDATDDDDGPPVGELVADGKVEVLLGDAVDWLPIFDVRADAQVEAWEVLAPVLATQQEVDDLLAQRPGRQVVDDLQAQEPVVPAPRAGLPDLDDISLETVPHSRRGLRLTFLELVSWLGHEPHSDAPTRTSPVLATYARWFASALDDRRRQELKSRARRMIGTGTSPVPRRGRGPAVLPASEVGRTWLATDWLIRVQASCWLKLAGITEAASRLESIGPTSDRNELVRAVDVLGSAIGIASRRLDLTASIAGTERAADVELVERAAWDAWEQASEAAGWVAASEAAGVGVPAELAYVTDVRVIECARDPRARDEVEAGRHTIGDAAWAAALHAMADEAWTGAWAAAAPAIDDLAVLPLRTALDRATRAAFSAIPDTDEDEREQALEQAEATAKELLTRAALDMPTWPADQHPWDAALEAAAAGTGGELWSRVQHLARAAVDDGPWEAGMAAARTAVDDVLHEAPDLVARAVGAALAREAAGAAARGVALRAAAVARAQGGSEDDAFEAARESLAPTVAQLQDAAFTLLDTLIAQPDPNLPATGT